MDLGLTGRTVIVTGSSRGIGRATADLFTAEGANVAVCYRTDRTAADAVVDGIRSRSGGDAIPVRCDLGDPVSIRAAVDAVLERWGRIDVLVNNAMAWIRRLPSDERRFEDIPPAEWQPVIRVNIEGTYAAIQEVLPSMRAAGWGRIVNISSVVAEEGLPGYASYSAAKAALHGLTRTLAKEVGPAGVLVNAVMPGATLTERVNTYMSAEHLTRQAQLLPIRRVPTPEDVAATVVYLGSAANTVLTGEVVRASGGRR